MIVIEIIVGVIEVFLLASVMVSGYGIGVLMTTIMKREVKVTDREDKVKLREIGVDFEVQSKLAEEFQKGWNARDAY